MLTSLISAADVLTVDSASTVNVTGATPAAAGTGEVRLGGGQVNANGTVTAGDVVIVRAAQAGSTEAVRGDDPRLTNARPASGGDAATVGGNAPSAFVATATKGVANGVASLDATGKVPAAQLPATSGSAKAWVRFDGTTGAILSSFNVSNVVHNSTGDYTVTFATPFANANYAASHGSDGIPLTLIYAAGSYRFATYSFNAVQSDYPQQAVVFFGY